MGTIEKRYQNPISKSRLSYLLLAVITLSASSYSHAQEIVPYNIFFCNNLADQQNCSGSCKRGTDTYFFHVNKLKDSSVLISARRNNSELNPTLLEFCRIESQASWTCLEVKEYRATELIKQITEYEFKQNLITSTTLTINKSFRSRDFYCYLPAK